MSFFELLIIAVGLAMDAFAVSISKGIRVRRKFYKYALITGAYFAAFQAVMPLICFLLGKQFQGYITSIDHWVAFLVLSVIGIKMIVEAKRENQNYDSSFGVKNMVILSLATSIDALAVGITFAFLKVEIVSAVSIIGVTTFILSVIGVRIGYIFGNKFKSKAEIIGGIILILMGIKILLEHLGVISF